jgi:hypothetical protein
MQLPPLGDMWPNYPRGLKTEVADEIGGTVAKNIRDHDWETCCIRLSRSLNLGGRPVEHFAHLPNPALGKDAKVRAIKGGDNKWYIYSCYDLRVYLEKTFGRPRPFGSYKESDLSGVRGIIMFAFRHVDLWNGSEVRYNKDFTSGKKTVREILVWESASDYPRERCEVADWFK